MEVTCRFKGLDLIECLKNHIEVHNTVQEVVIKTIPKKKECKKANCLSEEALQIAEKRTKRQRRKGKIHPLECRVPKKVRRDKKAFLSEQCKEIEENNRMGKMRDLFKKSEIPKEHFMQRWVQ